LLTTTTLRNWLSNEGLWPDFVVVVAKGLRDCEKNLALFAIVELEVEQLGRKAHALVLQIEAAHSAVLDISLDLSNERVGNNVGILMGESGGCRKNNVLDLKGKFGDDGV